MANGFSIHALQEPDIPFLTSWARQEGFAPGVGDLAIYRQTDRQGLWVGWLGQEPVGCIAGVRYGAAYGFIGLFLVLPEHRGKGHGVALWRRALDHLADLPCIGLEAAPERIDDYSGWGFRPASATTRWQVISTGPFADPTRAGGASPPSGSGELILMEGNAIPESAVQRFDAQRAPSPRPHFLHQWLQHPAGTVLALFDRQGECHGFGRIRPCLLRSGEGWRIGPLLAGSAEEAQRLLVGLLDRHRGVVLIDSPQGNPQAPGLLRHLGFQPLSQTRRMYRGTSPGAGLEDVYGLACLELG